MPNGSQREPEEEGTGGKALPDNDTENFGLLFCRRKRVVWKNPTLDTEEGAYGRLFDMWKFRNELISKAETHDRKTGDITFWIVLIKTFIGMGTKFVNRRKTDVIWKLGVEKWIKYIQWLPTR